MTLLAVNLIKENIEMKLQFMGNKNFKKLIQKNVIVHIYIYPTGICFLLVFA